MRILFLIFTTIPFRPAFAVEFKPHPSAKISFEKWHDYYEQVKLACSKMPEVSADQKLEAYHCNEDGIHIAFTQEGHPAYPAWIARQPVQHDKSIDIRTIGYFAGDEPAFARLFKQYLELNKRMKMDF